MNTALDQSSRPDTPLAGIQPASATGSEATNAFFDQLTADLQAGPLNLPCFPDIVPRVRAALDDPNSSAEDIVRIVATEPRLSARLIQTASSAVFNPSGNPAPNLKAAVTRLGRHLVQSVSMVFVVQQMRADPMLRTVSEPLSTLWRKSVLVALICQLIAKRIKVPTEKVFLTGLMHGIGHFYLIVRSAEPQAPQPYSALRQDIIDARHPDLGRSVLTKWGFEDIVAEAVGQQHDFARAPSGPASKAADIVDVLIAGVVLAEAALYLDGDLARTETVTAFQRLKFSAEELGKIITHSQHSLDSVLSTLSG